PPSMKSRAWTGSGAIRTAGPPRMSLSPREPSCRRTSASRDWTDSPSRVGDFRNLGQAHPLRNLRHDFRLVGREAASLEGFQAQHGDGAVARAGTDLANVLSVTQNGGAGSRQWPFDLDRQEPLSDQPAI